MKQVAFKLEMIVEHVGIERFKNWMLIDDGLLYGIW